MERWQILQLLLILAPKLEEFRKEYEMTNKTHTGQDLIRFLDWLIEKAELEDPR